MVRVLTVLLICVLFLFNCCETNQKENKIDETWKVKSEHFLGKKSGVKMDKFVNEDLKIEIGFPSNWNYVEVKEKEALLAFREPCDDPDFCSSFTLAVLPRAEGTTLKDYSVARIEDVRTNAKAFNMVNVKKDAEINSLNAEIVDYQLVLNEIDLGGTAVFLERKDQVFIISSLGFNRENGEYVKYRNKFEDVFNSFSSI